MADYPPPPYFHQTHGKLGAEQIFDLQSRRFMERMAEAWQTRFYRERWRAIGLEPGDIASLHDIKKIPTFTSDDLKQAIADAPPFGSHHPIGRNDFGRVPLKIHTSGGTTGMPRATLFDPISMEVQGIQTARAFYAQGGRPGDVIQITFTTSLANSGWVAYVGAFGWLGAVPVTTGSGKVTPSERQLAYAAAWRTNGWYILGDYLGRLTQVANDTGFDLHQLPTKFITTFLGPDADTDFRTKLEDAWGAPVYDNYGSHEVGTVAFECKSKIRHINEDTTYIEIIDQDSGDALPHGQIGSVVATSLYRSIPPFIRYNLRDRMSVSPHAACECGLCSRSLSAMMGRADEMVKLRGTNIYPWACQSPVKSDARTTGEFICVVSYSGDLIGRQEEMVVRVERRSREVDSAALAEDLRKALYVDLGARVGVEIVDAGALSDVCGSGEKPRRLLDVRRK
jgi:phenylacetate-CoA ligase